MSSNDLAGPEQAKSRARLAVARIVCEGGLPDESIKHRKTRDSR
jgi:hypothetical protein